MELFGKTGDPYVFHQETRYTIAVIRLRIMGTNQRLAAYTTYVFMDIEPTKRDRDNAIRSAEERDKKEDPLLFQGPYETKVTVQTRQVFVRSAESTTAQEPANP